MQRRQKYCLCKNDPSKLNLLELSLKNLNVILDEWIDDNGNFTYLLIHNWVHYKKSKSYYVVIRKCFSQLFAELYIHSFHKVVIFQVHFILIKSKTLILNYLIKSYTSSWNLMPVRKVIPSFVFMTTKNDYEWFLCLAWRFNYWS